MHIVSLSPRFVHNTPQHPTLKTATIPATDTDPFGNKTVFSCPDQVTVNPATTQKTYHYVFRDANSYAKSVAMSANAEVHTGVFKASVSVQQAHQTMSDGLNIIAESTSEIGIYTITLDAPLVLQLDEKLKQFIETLPDEYNTTTADAFDQFVQFYGTHYVSAITLGGKATMHSIITQAFAGTHSNTVVQAQVSASWMELVAAVVQARPRARVRRSTRAARPSQRSPRAETRPSRGSKMRPSGRRGPNQSRQARQS